MFHLELFSSSIATSGSNTFQQLTYVSADAILPTQINGLTVISDLPYLHSVIGVGSHLCHQRLQFVSMQPMPYITIDPGNRGSAIESPPRVWDISAAPRRLRITEEFDVFVTQNSGGAETEYVATQFCDGPVQMIPVTLNPLGLEIAALTPGQFLSAHATATTTLVGGAWTQVIPAFDLPLPAGTYGVVGMRVFSATGLFFRLFPATGPKWRPGGHCVQSYDAIDWWGQRAIPWGGKVLTPWGIWMTFYQNVPPKVEIFPTGNDTAEEFDFDLVYLGPQVMGG